MSTPIDTDDGGGDHDGGTGDDLDWGLDAGSGESEAAALMADTKELSQEEIDRLLNFAVGPQTESAGQTRAIERLISTTTVNKDRLPMLDVVFDRMVRLLNTSLRQFSSTSVEASLLRIDWLRYNEFLDTIELPALVGVARAEQWDNHIVVSVDSALIYCMMDVLDRKSVV